MTSEPNPALDALRHHVTGAIERGESEPIKEQSMTDRMGTFETVVSDGENITGRVYYVRENGWACVETDPGGRLASGPPPTNPIDRQAFIDGYIECALWADCMPPESDPDGETGGCENLTLRPGAREKMSVDCLDFIAANEADLIAYAEAMGDNPLGMWAAMAAQGRARSFSGTEKAGHDFWLTRSGHGAGFWDRGLGELGERLTKASKAYGSPDDHTPYDCGDGTADV